MSKKPYFKLVLFLSLLAVGSPAFAEGQAQTCPEIRASLEPTGSQAMADFLVERSERVSNANQFDGVSTTFGPFGFKVFDVLDVVAEVREIGTTTWLLDGTASFAKGPGTPDTFSVTFSQVYANTYEYRVRGKRTHERSTAISKGTGLNLDALARELAEIAYVLQEMRRDVDNVDGSAAQDAAFAAQTSAGQAAQSAVDAANHLEKVAFKTSCKAATVSNIVLSGEQTIDGVALVTGDRCLVKNQTAAAENGIYTVDGSAWARPADANAWDELVSAVTVVEQGAANADTVWVCTSNQGGTLGTTDLTWDAKLASGVVASDDTTFSGVIAFANGIRILNDLLEVTEFLTVRATGPDKASKIKLDKPASGDLSRVIGTMNDLARWAADYGDATAEGGANSGSHFRLKRYDDFGVFIENALTIFRDTGQMLLNGELTFPKNSKIAWDIGITQNVGNGSPEGAVEANVGSIYLRRDGIPGQTFYVKESGSGLTTGWVAK